MENGKIYGRGTPRENVRKVAVTGVLSGMAFLLMMAEFPLWCAPGFYRLDFSGLPALMAGFALGPLSGAAVELIKVLLYFFLHGSSTAGVGDFANFIIGCCMVMPAACFYRHRKTRRSAMEGLLAGTLLMTAAGSLTNAYVLLPLYSRAMNLPMEAFIEMGSKVNSAVTDLRTLILFAVVPFNLLKGTLVSVLTALLYKKVSPVLHGTGMNR